jgi:nucleoside-diphosphate-sugar epimerase
MSYVFITGATGFLGSYVADILLRETDTKLFVLTRAKDEAEFEKKIWDGLQLHRTAAEFWAVRDRMIFIRGDLTAPGLGISEADQKLIVSKADSVLHIAASLNRKSEKECLNHNLRGTLAVIKLAQRIDADHGLRRFSHVSTAAVSGHRSSEVVEEDKAIEWDRSDYDPYGRTKKFCEHMVRELLPNVQKTFFRPSIVMGDSRFPDTSQFDMVRAFCVLVDLPVVPFSGNVRQDIVNADWVGRAIATIHMKPNPKWDCYHLSNGTSSFRAIEIAEAIHAKTGRRVPIFSPALEGPFGSIMNQLASSKSRNVATLVGSLFKVFLPYITYDTVFDNSRAVKEIGLAPAPFTKYAASLYAYAKQHDYKYPYRPLPARPVAQAAE